MSRAIVGIRFVCAFAFVGAMAPPSAAQTMQPMGGANPFSGLFKGSSPTDQPHRLDLNGSTFVAWDDNVLAQAPNGQPDAIGIDPRGVRQGIANGFQASIGYGFHSGGTRNQFNVDAQGSLQRFASTAGDPLLFESYNAGAGFRSTFTPKMSLRVSGGSSYAPFYRYAPFLTATGNEESPVGSDYGYASVSEWVQTNSAGATFEDRFSKRSRISADVNWEQRQYPNNRLYDIDTLGARVTLSHNLTKKLAVHVGYGVQQSRYQLQQNEPLLLHNLDVGVGYGDGITLTFGRHYTLSMSIGASLVKNGDPFVPRSENNQTTFVVNGAATLSRSIGRTWGASLGYIRGTSYVVGIAQPLLTDSANAGVGGPISSRLHFSAGAGASHGQQLFTEAAGNIVSYTASTRLTFALFKSLGLYTQASYYRYSVPEGFHPFGFTPDLDRRSVSAGLTAWLPLIKPPRVRRTDDPAQTEQSDRDTR